uniref:Uncharacterized protein n=1 Tax=Oryza sativa subsp. japonica TaxID=39947 RepID=Q9LWZ5_ORYSJ|nr:hypothetical protein [Oryza sativa Japonica Group]
MREVVAELEARAALGRRCAGKGSRARQRNNAKSAAAPGRLQEAGSDGTGAGAARLKPSLRALFSCGIFSACTHLALSPTVTPNNNVACHQAGCGGGVVAGCGGGGGVTEAAASSAGKRAVVIVSMMISELATAASMVTVGERRWEAAASNGD